MHGAENGIQFCLMFCAIYHSAVQFSLRRDSFEWNLVLVEVTDSKIGLDLFFFFWQMCVLVFILDIYHF